MTPSDEEDTAVRTVAFAMALTRSFGARALMLAREQQMRATGSARATWDRVVAQMEADNRRP